MPEVNMNGPEGRLEGRFYPTKLPNSPVAILLHPHPQHGGSMNNKVVYQLYQTFVNRGFATLRFNFRGVGRSQGTYDRGEGELSDAASALDWLQSVHTDAPQCWIAGFSFGAWIGMQLLMRRPEISGFISISPPANMYDFSFLAPFCFKLRSFLIFPRPHRVTPEHLPPLDYREESPVGLAPASPSKSES